MAASSFPELEPEPSRQNFAAAFIGTLSRSRFFTISVALHFVFVLTFGSIVLVKQVTQRTDFDDPGGSLVAPAPPASIDPVQPLTPPTAEAVSSSAASNAPTLTSITTNSTMPAAFVLPSAPASMVMANARTFTDPGTTSAPQAPKFNGIPANQAKGMKAFTNSWRSGKDSGSGVGKDRAFQFTAYLAKYAGGDWDSTVRVVGGRVTTGSLPNLLYIIRKWSHDKIEAEADAVPLDLASDEIFTRKPPFIFFTGHRDFTLNEREIENLQKYIQLGGAIWGDSSLPGQRSRFDIAFRREMKRVLSDADINWEVLPPTHPIFTQKYFPEVVGVPPGINSYQEPVYALKNLGEIAVIYTANDYGDMWQVGLNERGDYDTGRDEHNAYVAMNGMIFDNREVYFRGLSVKDVTMSYKFGTNIILHLLTRWEDKLRNVPTGL